eukprot:TRINITY_DN80017_c0_g1_i1.p1 TRINITY_DN80017_c0_g1~~TRINITY_DN80017_c0_g1_i1.p1  ORF type:complete len:432 (+),score=60.39 TRINITY_DN80017_c0_g1_i1:51-1346(+)
MVAADYTLLQASPSVSVGDVWRHFWLVGFLSFGGTQANMAMFYQMIVTDLRWVDAAEYAELLGLVQSLPGPSAAQILLAAVVVATGSPWAGLLAFVLFCLPGAAVMALLGCLLPSTDITSLPIVHAVQLSVGCAAIALVAAGSWQLGEKLAYDKLTRGLWLATCLASYACSASPTGASVLILVCLVGGGIISYQFAEVKGNASQQKQSGEAALEKHMGVSRFLAYVMIGAVLLVLMVVFLLPFVMKVPAWFPAFSVFYNVGCLVFGGGPVVIPLLLLQLVAEKLIDSHQFALGFAAVQLLPGPMFNLAAFCGALIGGWQGALSAWFAITVPGVLFVLGALPFWAELRQSPKVKRGLIGVNACAAGLMGSTVLLLWETLVGQSKPQAIFAVAFTGLTMFFGVKPYLLMCLGVIAGVLNGLACELDSFCLTPA